MGSPGRPILALPNRTRSVLRSAVVLPSFASIAAELVLNALDARATSIHVTVDLATWSVHCIDNGHGIPSHHLASLGRHATTKFGPGDGFGSRGEALESMQDLAMLSVTSRTRGSTETYHLVRRDGETLHFAPAPTPRNEPGTTVSVRDVFYKYPVRRKTLASRSAQLATVSDVRSELAVTALVHPGVSFHLTDTSSREPKSLLAVTRTAHGIVARWKQLWGRAGVEHITEFDQTDPHGIRLHGFIALSASHGKSSQFIFINDRPIPPLSSPLHKTINQLFASSTFARHASSLLSLPQTSASPLNSRGLSSSPARLTPTVSGPGRGRTTPNKTVEKHPVFLFRLEFGPQTQSETSFGIGEFGRDNFELQHEDRAHQFVRNVVEEFLVRNGFRPAPAAPRRPPSLDSTRGGCKRTREEDDGKGLDDDLQSALSTTFTRRARRKGVGPNTEIGIDGRKEHAGDEAAHVAQIVKGGRDDVTPYQPTKANTRTGINLEVAPEHGRSGSPSGDKPVEEGSPSRNLSTGPNYDTRSRGRGDVGEKLGMVDRRALKGRTQAGASGSGSPVDEGRPEWLTQVLSKWDNPIYPAAKPAASLRIPSLAPPRRPLTSATLLTPTGSSSSKSPFAFTSSKPSLSSGSKRSATTKLTHTRLAEISTFFSSTTPAASTFANASSLGSVGRGGATTTTPAEERSFSRASLASARYIAQVDDKYLVVRLDDATLVMFDQHAVSERIRVEKLLEGVCGRRPEGNPIATMDVTDDVRHDALRRDEDVREVDEPAARSRRGIGVVVSRDEFRQLTLVDTLAAFRRWGFQIAHDARSGDAESSAAASSPSTRDYVQVWIETVPLVVGPRLVQDSDLLQRLVRGYLAQIRDRPPPPLPPSPPAAASRRLARGGFDNDDYDGNDETSWVETVKDCPTGLVELINSKACRGAIMFNDRLRDEQARDLLVELSRTKFPFVCAHGRPSIVPLVNLGGGRELDSERAAPRQNQGAKIDWSRLSLD